MHLNSPASCCGVSDAARSVRAAEKAGRAGGGEIRFPRRLERPRLVVQPPWIEAAGTVGSERKLERAKSFIGAGDAPRSIDFHVENQPFSRPRPILLD
jgi:hypothetical protein